MDYKETDFSFLYDDLTREYGNGQGKKLYTLMCEKYESLYEQETKSENQEMNKHIFKRLLPTIGICLTLTERNFDMMSEKYQKEQLEVETRLKEVSETLNGSYEKSQGVRDFLSLIRSYQGIKELDAAVVNALIDKILVSERETLADGTVQQEIRIYYKFIGFVGELHIAPTRRWTALPEKHCAVCGIDFTPKSAVAKYCPVCSKKVQREKSNESKRRSRERSRRQVVDLLLREDV